MIFRQGAGHVEAEQRRPIRASCTTAASTTGSRSCAARDSVVLRDVPRSALGTDRPERPEHGVDRDRRPRRHPDGHPHGDERRLESPRRTRLGHRPGRHHGRRQPVVAHRSLRAETKTFTRHVHADDGARSTRTSAASSRGRRRGAHRAHPARRSGPVALAAPAEVTVNRRPAQLRREDRLRRARSTATARGLVAGDADARVDGRAGSGRARSTAATRRARRADPVTSRRATIVPRRDLRGRDHAHRHRPRPVRLPRRHVLVGAQRGRRLERGGDDLVREPGGRSDVHRRTCTGSRRNGPVGAGDAVRRGRSDATSAGNMTVAGTAAGRRSAGRRRSRPRSAGLAAATRYLGCRRLQQRPAAIGRDDRSASTRRRYRIRQRHDEGPAQAGPSSFRQE